MLSPDQGVPLTASGNCICHPAKARRGFLTGLAALGAATALPGCATNSGAASGRYRIDTHHHLFSPADCAQLVGGKNPGRHGSGWRANLDAFGDHAARAICGCARRAAHRPREQ